MFLEDEDWSDARGNVPSPPAAPKENSSPNVKTKLVGKKSLLRTLQTLGSVPEWKNEDQEKGSDSDTQTPTTEQGKKKRRKKRHRKRKHEETEEQTKNKQINQGDTEDTDPPKRRKKDKLAKKVKPKTTDTTKNKETTKPVKDSAEDSEKKLSRKQWKNRMKNKRKCKNKFRSKEEASEGEKKSKEADASVTSQENKEENKKRCRKEAFKQSSDGLEESKVEDKEVKRKKVAEDAKVQEQVTPQKSVPNKKARLKKEKLRKLFENQEKELPKMDESVKEPAEVAGPEKAEVKASPPDASASLRARMEQRLESARFRFINEALYSCTSKEAKRMFLQDPQAFWVYHRGYSAQVQRWPNNPVDDIIQFIHKKPQSLVVADFGCGDCKIAKSVKNKVHSFDLVATCDLVTACDMANVPLKDGSVDIAVFCLSLMGTNLTDFLKEANRVLKKGGFLKIAEVSSRFDNVRGFLTALASLGFKLLSKDTENTHFYSFEFVKTGPAPENLKKIGLELKPCLYKKR